MPILSRQYRGVVGIIQRILDPNQLQRVQIHAHQVSAIVRDKQIALVYIAAVLHSKPVLLHTRSCSRVVPFDHLVRIDRNLSRRLVIYGIQMEEIQDAVFPRPDQCIGFCIHKRRRIKVAQVSPE